MDEPSARQVVLAEAIETADADGRLLTQSERDQVDRQARHDAVHRQDARAPIDPEEFIHLRARRVLAAVGVRHSGVVALQEPGAWSQWLQWLSPLVALILGVGTDAIGNPHRVDLVSLPLLGIVAWNLLMYLVIVLGALWPRGQKQKRPLLAGLGRWSDGAHALRRRPPDVEAQVAAKFRMRWFELTQALHFERVKRVLHLSAAAWAAGVILSLLVRGLVVEYRVGWESTFLGPSQVFAILSVLRLPALLVFPFETFTVMDVAQLRFSDGGGTAGGASWVWMYVALLLVVVILPRLLLAAWAAWRESRLERRLPIDFEGEYYARVVSLLSSTHVQVALLSHRQEDRDRMLRVLAPDPASLPILVSTDLGDVLRLVDLPLTDVPAQQQGAAVENGGWMSRWRTRVDWGARVEPSANSSHASLTQARESNLVLHLAAGGPDVEAARPLLEWLGRPVLEIDMGAGRGLAFQDFARCWIQDRALLDAIARPLPAQKKAGFDRIVRAWEERNAETLRLSMMAVADHLLFAARQVEEVHAGALTVRNLLPAERQAQTHARQAAMDAIVRRLDESARSMGAQLRKLHGIDEAQADAMEHRLEERFVVQQPVDAPQAGMAGAATGAAMGASVDLLAGGLTLGAAAALGALVGGGAAYIAAAWKNRASPSGATVVQLSDEMLEAMTEAALLRYVAVVHWARGRRDVDDAWKTQVAGALEARKVMLRGYWGGARAQPNPDRLVQPFGHELEGMARTVLNALYEKR